MIPDAKTSKLQNFKILINEVLILESISHHAENCVCVRKYSAIDVLQTWVFNSIPVLCPVAVSVTTP